MLSKGIREREIGEIWFSPLAIYKHINRLVKKVGSEAIEKNGNFKPVREARITAITALAMFIMRDEIPTYIQLSASEDSLFDSYVCQRFPHQRETLFISNIQVTSYRDNSKEDFLTQLKRTKVPPGRSLFSDKCVVVYDLLTKKPLPEEEQIKITEYLNANKTPFPVWTFRAISISPDTIGEMVILNPTRKSYIINFGKIAYRYKELRMQDSVRIMWVSKKSQLKEDEYSGTYSLPPWDPIIEEL
ncbi:MAG: hypothetical protein M1372_02400 [Patescibacteria group bacterium]|nr:hypothetical protein [Patescibacteria group bacterium]